MKQDQAIKSFLLLSAALVSPSSLRASRGTLLLAAGLPVAVTLREGKETQYVAAVAAGLIGAAALTSVSKGRLKLPVRSAALFGAMELAIGLLFFRRTNPPGVPRRPRRWSNSDREEVAKGTLAAIKAGSYGNGRGQTFPLRSGPTLCEQSERLPLEADGSPRRDRAQLVRVAGQDCLEAAGELAAKGLRTAVVVFASTIEAGGGFSEGTSGQEEHCCYRSELAGFMQDQIIKFTDGFYPIGPAPGEVWRADSSYLIHVPNVQVFRASQAEEFRFLDRPFAVGMICCPAPVYPELREGDYAHETDRVAAEKLIRAQLRVASQQGYDAVVLGAFGCGAFRNPAETIAQMFRDVLRTDYSGAFAEIVFAILDDPTFGVHNPRGNLAPFSDLFQGDGHTETHADRP